MYKFNFKILFALVLAILSYYLNISQIFSVSKVVGDIFISFLKLISLPIVFFSITSTVSGLKSSVEVKYLTKKTLFYTLFTTLAAATVAFSLYLLINPARNSDVNYKSSDVVLSHQDYLGYLLSILPYNFIKVFLDNNVIGCMVLAFLIGGASLSLPNEKRELLHELFSAIFDTLIEVAKLILKFIPIAIWAFTTSFLYNLDSSHELSSILWYFVCIVLANFIQALIVLPVLIKYKGISFLYTLKSVFPALVIAFFSKSSSAALPATMKCVQENLKVPKKLSSFVLPICTTINMNACAAFILITVLFVSEMNGYNFSLSEMFLWIIFATGAAVGNAGVPMGCYFMATSYLISMKVPIHIMGIILPFYTVLDMFETSINVWSDVCVTQIINKECTTDDQRFE